MTPCEMLECFRSALARMAAASHVASGHLECATKALSLLFYQVLLYLSLRSPVWLLVTAPEGSELEDGVEERGHVWKLKGKRWI